jgi:hypothetical protein
MTGRLIVISSALCLMLYDCGPSSRFAPRKPDPTKGTVTGTVTCADTGKPARFATVELLPSPNSPTGEGAPGEESAETDLDGKFKIEAVAPGDYFVFATLDGYLNPMYGIDFDRLSPAGDNNKQTADVIEQWKDHMTQISVSAHNETHFTVQIERGAEVTGTVSYDDGSPAIGMRFSLYRKNGRGGWSTVGPHSEGGFALEEKSDARGHFAITNLPEGEYAVCTLLPGNNQAGSPQVCFGNVFRKKDVRTVTANPGDAVNGVEIVIPLKAIHSVAGSVVQAITNQPPSTAKLNLLYADDREEAITVDMFSDGSFLFPFVPLGSYVLKVTDASYSETAAISESTGSSGNATPARIHTLADREMMIMVEGDVNDIKVPLVETPPNKPALP